MAEDSRKLFVAGLPDSITEDVLRQLFEATGGSVVEVSLPKDRATGRPRGFGFVTLATSEEANSARESLDGSFQGGKSISVRPFQAEPPKREGGREGGRGPGGGPGGMGGGMGGGPPGGPAAAPDRTLYVGNLPYDASQEEVESLITATGAGPVVRVHLPMDPDGRKRGFGPPAPPAQQQRKAYEERKKRNFDGDGPPGGRGGRGGGGSGRQQWDRRGGTDDDWDD